MSGEHGSWHVPFEESSGPPEPLHDADQAIVVGAIVVIGAVADTPLGRHPMLVFRFEGADGAMLPPIALLVDAPTMRNIPGIITGAANAAIRRAGAS